MRKGEAGNKSMFRFADRTDKWLMLLGTLGSIGDGLQGPLTMYVVSTVINEYGNPNAFLSTSIVNKYALRILYVSLGVGLSAFVEGICWTRTAERQTSRMRIEYLKSILKQDVGFFDTQAANTSTSYQVVSSITSDVNSIQVVIGEKVSSSSFRIQVYQVMFIMVGDIGFLRVQIPDCLAFLSSFIFCLIFAFILSWKLALAALPFVFMFIMPGIGFGKLMMDLGVKMIASYMVAGSIAEQAISSIRIVYSYVAEQETLSRFSNALQKTADYGIKQGFAKGLMMGSMGIIFVCWAFQAWMGSFLVTEKGEKGGAVFVAGFNVLLGGLCILSALPNLTALAEATAAATRIFEMIDRQPNIDSDDKKGKALAYVRGEIEFRNVNFSYPSRPDTPILKNFNLLVPLGKTVGLVGGSGSGKSTVISLLERFYDPSKGEILLDGYKINRLQLKWLRSQMGLVNQEPILFATSIKENILFGREGASMDLVINAAKAANAHDFIVQLPDGYETRVGQFGVQLSGGQKQRIAMARALIREPKILLLDEATSALDAQSERVVQDALDQASRGRTTIIIAHRLSTIQLANLIVVLQSGEIVESGTHDDLMQRNGGAGGEYAKLVQLQHLASQNEAVSSVIYEKGGRTPQRMSRVLSPMSRRSSGMNSPVAYPFSPAYSVASPYSIQLSYYEDSGDEISEESAYASPSQWRLLKMNAPEWGNALLGCIGALGSGAVQPINAYFLGELIAVYFRNDSSVIKSHARLYSIVFLGLGALNFITNLVQHYNFAVMGERFVKRVREEVLEKLMTFEVGWFDKDENTSAAICARLATEANMVRTLVGERISLLAQTFSSAALAYILGLALSWRLALVIIAVQPILIGSFYTRSVLMKSMAEKARKAQKEGGQIASEAAINYKTIAAFSSQKRILGLFKATMKGPKRESLKQSLFSGFGLFSSQFLTTAFTALAFWYGGRLMTKGLITPEHLFQAFLILLFTGKTIADAGSMTSDLSKGSNAIRSIFAILDRKSDIEPENSWGLEVDQTIKGNIELKNVFFAYPSRPNQLIFKGLNLRINAGQTVALVGQSGSGKSTIIGLIERFYDPTKGWVYVDNKDIKNYNLRVLRTQIALVSQEPTLFSGTIRDNIAYGNEDASESEIRKAAALANAHDFISGMKDGYSTYCGERGVQLSGGQKQRIVLARAILKNPSILLLDEATSALDSVSENLVQAALEQMTVGRTCVIVAHRLSTIQKADSIAVIKDGSVVEQGSHTKLLSYGRGGAYYSLIKPQGGNSPYRKAHIFSTEFHI
ncbi:ABC transporter-like, ATP-binding domain [Dillenia turbinata]|uniref:ABC transporter-like, ATP-binding domain n=1 Tax=Dillenia turbinata TaxID=194707 RepID=A0AAN8VG31_9MAGN